MGRRGTTVRVMKPFLLRALCVLSLAILAGCDCEENRPKGTTPSTSGGRGNASLSQARQGFQTRLLRQDADAQPAPEPPAEQMRLVRYDSPAGKLAAYVSIAPNDNQKRPAIVWVFGGFGNDIGETAWEPGPPDNDQSASAFWKAGVVTMYPSLRGGNGNPGFKEAFYGEVDDVLAAAAYLASQPGVDPKRVYLGGHSTGGTLALLVAETLAAEDRFRAVFAFGPIDDVGGYGPEYLPFDTSDARELELRAPIRWLDSIKTPTFVFEGAGPDGNLPALRALEAGTKNPNVRFRPVPGADHFNLLGPMTQVIAGKILRDTGEQSNITFGPADLVSAGAQ